MYSAEQPYLTTNISTGVFKVLNSTWDRGPCMVTLIFTGTTNCIFSAADATAAAAGVPYIALATPGPIEVFADPSRMWFRSNGASATNVTAYVTLP